MKKRNLSKKLVLFLVLSIGAIGFYCTLFSKYVRVRSERTFNKLSRDPKYNLSIGLFYKAKKKHTDPKLYEKIQDTKEMFRRASEVFRYRDADLLFLSVNLLRKRNDTFVAQYRIDQWPVFILFQDGIPYKDQAGRVVKITGFIDRPELEKFIDSRFGVLINRNRERNRRIRRKKMEESIANYYSWPYWSWGFGWGYPGWGWGYGWRGGYGGCW